VISFRQFVIPAKAGTQEYVAQSHEATKKCVESFVALWLCAKQNEIPASAGMTGEAL
jgi:hypothetical protein